MKLKRFGAFKKTNENNEFQEKEIETPGRAPKIDDIEMSMADDTIEDSYEEEEGYDKFTKLKGKERTSFSVNGESYKIGDMMSLSIGNKDSAFEVVNITDSEIETVCKISNNLVIDKDYMFFISDLKDGSNVTAYYDFASETNKWMKKTTLGTIQSIEKK
jgi:hypothetical protein